MGYFEDNIYIQTAHQGVRNKDILNVNTSSDICVFTSPTYTMSGASKILPCFDTSDCVFSAQPFTDILSGATGSCASYTADCSQFIKWKTRVSENDVVVYSADFYTTTGITVTTPTDLQFTGSVVTAFDSLGYDYTTTGTTFTIKKPYGTTKLDVDICVVFDVDATCAPCSATCTNVCSETFSAITTANTSVHIITTATTQDISFDFTGGTSGFIDNDAKFKYEIFKLDTDIGTFHNPPQYRSEEVEWSTFSGTSALTQTIPIIDLDIDGDYLIKGFFVHDICTEISNRLGYTNDTSLVKIGESFGLYDKSFDYYMSIFSSADTPVFNDSGQSNGIISLEQKVIIPKDGETVFVLPSGVLIDFIVTLNGIVLSNNHDYSISQYSGGTNPYVVTLSSSTLSTDILTFIYATTTDNSGLKTETIDVISIPTGPTDGQGTDKIYYNTTESKYELFLTLPPSSNNDILIMINGVTLANNIDYYQSISNSKRIIFNGTILVGDIIVSAYNQAASFVDSVNTSNPTISWSIVRAPTIINGRFILEFASDEGMTHQVSSAETSYSVDTNSYLQSSIISGSVGTELYYRVTNIKDYETICGDVVQSKAYSEVVPITIATNSINSY